MCYADLIRQVGEAFLQLRLRVLAKCLLPVFVGTSVAIASGWVQLRVGKVAQAEAQSSSALLTTGGAGGPNDAVSTGTEQKGRSRLGTTRNLAGLLSI
jgi:hypothetical protein